MVSNFGPNFLNAETISCRLLVNKHNKYEGKWLYVMYPLNHSVSKPLAPEILEKPVA